MHEIRDDMIDRQAVTAMSARFDNPPDLREATTAELQDTWDQIAAVLSGSPPEAVEAEILYFAVEGGALPPDVTARAIALLSTIHQAES